MAHEASLWLPDASAPRPDSEALRIDASHTLRQPVLVDTTCGEVQRIVQRMRSETRDDLVRLSNQRYRDCVSVPATELAGEETWGRFCGDVIVFHCARWVLDESGIPVRPCPSTA